jgi:hypothetical protein
MSSRTVEAGLAADRFFAVRTTDVSAFCRSDLAELLGGATAALLVRDFLPEVLCQAAMDGIGDPTFPMAGYDRARVDPPIARFGPVINDYNRECELEPAYWGAASGAGSLWRAAMAGRDPLAASLARLSRAWGAPVGDAVVGGRKLFAGTVREINDGARVHFDDVRREFSPGLFDAGPPIVQLAFNTYLSVPEAGGRTTIWRHRWHPRDDEFRQGYGYADEAVRDDQSLTLLARLGDALLFDPRHFHAVDPGAGGRRIALAFFLGLSSDGQLYRWS